jgi:hypothetical protein
MRRCEVLQQTYRSLRQSARIVCFCNAKGARKTLWGWNGKLRRAREKK